MAHFAHENAKLVAKIKEQAAQLDIASRVASEYKWQAEHWQEQDYDRQMCVICCEFFNCDDDICPSGEPISQNFEAARCGQLHEDDFDIDAVCFSCRPFTGWVTAEVVDTDGERFLMNFCSEKCKQMSEKMRACENDLLTEEQRFWKDT